VNIPLNNSWMWTVMGAAPKWWQNRMGCC